MPELPEVEITCQSLKKILKGRTFTTVLTRRKGLRYPFPEHFSHALLQRKVIDLYRKAKYIIVVLEDSFNLIIHLGMSGRIKILPLALLNPFPLTSPQSRPSTKELSPGDHPSWGAHDHVIFTIGSDSLPSYHIVYHDPRRFGFMDIIATSHLEQHRYFKHLGPDPLEEAFTSEIFTHRLKKSKKPLKHSLLDQRLLVGVGNIYACEALFQAGLSPHRLSSTLTIEEMTALYHALREILLKAITQGGSSFKDYHHINGEKGHFQKSFKVYAQQGKPCPNCKVHTVQRIVQQGRSTFYCSHCQQ